MRHFFVAGLFAALSAMPAIAQPAEGDLIVAAQMAPSILMRVNPTTGAWTTLAQQGAQTYGNVVMDADNTSLLASRTISVVHVTPTGQVTSLVTAAQNVRGPALDGDGRWIVAGTSSLLLAWDANLSLTTIADWNARHFATYVAIDPTRPDPYLVAEFPDHVLAVDRAGVASTIAAIPGWNVHAVMVRPATGDYVVTGVGNPAIAFLSKSGVVTQVETAPRRVSGCRMNPDGTMWVTISGPPAELELRDGVGRVIRTVRPVGSPARFVGVEVYGRRKLVCIGSGRPGTSVLITVQSRRPGDATMPYAIACSLAPRPGAFLGNGEFLGLAPDPLFSLTAMDRAPAIFRQFRGTLSSSGNGNAEVRIPASLPGGLGVTVFVAAVIYDASGVRTVTNTHFFVLT